MLTKMPSDEIDAAVLSSDRNGVSEHLRQRQSFDFR